MTKKTQEKVQAIVERALVDEKFREELTADPSKALADEGLSEDELDAVVGGVGTAAPAVFKPASDPAKTGGMLSLGGGGGTSTAHALGATSTAGGKQGS